MTTHTNLRRAIGLSAGILLLVSLPLAAQQAGEDRPRRGQERFEELDVDQSGTISADEVLANPMVRFDQADADGDNQLTIEELAAFARQEHGQLPGHALMRFNRADADADGVLTRAELTTAASSLFETLDVDADGEVTMEEAREGMRAMHEERGARRGEGHRRGQRASSERAPD